MRWLLVSVRSAAEAVIALENGADVIDVKEPAAGSLGRASDAVIAEVVRSVAGRRKVSAAMGELDERRGPCAVAGLTWVKWGLAGTARSGIDWRAALRELRRSSQEAGLVAVAYADWERAAAPSVAEVCAFACGDRLPVLLVDTWQKDGTNLLDWLSLERVRDVCRCCREAGVRVALAGSLKQGQIDLLWDLAPDFFAVRGAVCERGERGGIVDGARVRALARSLTW
jgi:uncharacterized protein (UPF0264 family)